MDQSHEWEDCITEGSAVLKQVQILREIQSLEEEETVDCENWFQNKEHESSAEEI